MHRESAAEHRGARRELVAAGVELDKLFRRPHVGHRTLLVEPPDAAVGYEREQHKLVSMRLDLLVAPQGRANRLASKLLRQRHADGLVLAIGVVGTKAKPLSI